MDSVEDTRSLDELLNFIEGAQRDSGSSHAPNAASSDNLVKTKSKKKKKKSKSKKACVMQCTCNVDCSHASAG